MLGLTNTGAELMRPQRTRVHPVFPPLPPAPLGPASTRRCGLVTDRDAASGTNRIGRALPPEREKRPTCPRAGLACCAPCIQPLKFRPLAGSPLRIYIA